MNTFPKTIGIDFGTTKTIAAYIDSTEMRPRSVRLGRNDAIPTTVYVDPSGRIDIGDDADDNRILDWKGYVRRIKRELGRKKNHLLNGHSLSTVDLIGHFLCKVLEKVENEAIYARPDHVVLTFPAKFGPAKQGELEQGIRASGIESFELITEPVAAALAWLSLNPNSQLGSKIMVFDWGGGTLDVAVLERDGNGFRQFPSLVDGDENLGGEDIDDALITGIDSVFRDAGLLSFDQRNDRERDLIIKRIAENKVIHSRKEMVRWSFALEDTDTPFSWEWNRAEFEEWIRPQVSRAVSRAIKVMDIAQSENVNIDQVILIGGSSRIPLVGDLLKKEIGLTPLRWDRSIEAVGYGAAIKAAEFKDRPTRSRAFDSKKSEMARYLEAIEIAWADGTISPEECEFLKKKKIDLALTDAEALSLELQTLGCGLLEAAQKQRGAKGETGTCQAISISFSLPEFGYFIRAHNEQNFSAEVIMQEHLLMGADILITNISDEPLINVQMRMARKDQQFGSDYILIAKALDPYERVRLSTVQSEWFFETGDQIEVTSHKQPEPLSYTVKEHEAVTFGEKCLPVLVSWVPGTFSGKVLQLRNMQTNGKPIGIIVKKFGAETQCLMLQPGTIQNVGWAEMSDSKNFSSGEILIIEHQIQGEYAPSIGIILE